MKRIILVVFYLVGALTLSAQSVALTKADNLYRMYAYSEAAESYEKLLDKKEGNDYLIQQLAYCYNKMGMYTKALSYYQLHITGKRARYEDFYEYANLLLTEGQFTKAIEAFEVCVSKNENDERPAQQIARIKDFDRLNLLHLVDTVYNLSLNTRFADMSAAFFADSIAFVSARDSSGNNTYSWNNQPFLDIYQFGKNKKDEIEIQKIPGVNTKYHEGPLVFTNNDQSIWFTRNNQKFSTISGEQTNNLRIYIADWNGKKWTDLRDFQYNSNDYSVGHPAFSPDGKTMYFASNMEGAIGETDLFKVTKIETEGKKGKIITEWSEPKNMGPQFNTQGKEMFPYVDSRGVIFFASDGFIGFGGLDIYAAFPVADTFNIINLGQPINSTYDDFSFIVSNDFTTGYLTSNRSGGVGSDDIYSINIGLQHLYLYAKSLQNGSALKDATIYSTVDGVTSELGKTNDEGMLLASIDFHKNYYFEVAHPAYISNNDSIKAFEIFKITNHAKTIYVDNASQLQVLTLNEENGDPLAGVQIKLVFANGKSEELLSDATGKINYRLKNTGLVQIKYHKNGFVSQEGLINIDVLGKGNFSTSASMEPIYEGKTFTLENLYYDVNSAAIRPDAALVLDELYKIMNEFPQMKIELSSHTDSRGDAGYNQNLSQKRAQSAVDYLVSKGIGKDRMIAVGYGEKKLLNQCADGVECSPEEHQVNRRTEFKVLEF